MTTAISNHNGYSSQTTNFNKPFSSAKAQGTYNKAMGNSQELQAWLEEAMVELAAVQNGQAPVPAGFANAQEYIGQLTEWIAWTQNELSSTPQWSPSPQQSPYSNNPVGYNSGGLPQEPNGFIAGPLGSYVANWSDVEINYYAGHPSNAYETMVMTDELTVNSSAFVNINVTAEANPKSGEMMIKIVITDPTFGTSKVIWVNPEAKIKINSANPDKITIDANAAALTEITTDKFSSSKVATDATLPPHKEGKNGELIFEQPNLVIDSIGGKTANIYSTQSVSFITEATDTINITNATLDGKEALQVVITDIDGNIKGAYLVRKVKGLNINFPNAIAENFSAGNTQEFETLQDIGPKQNQLTISYAGMEDATKDAKIDEAAKALGIEIEELYKNEALLNVIQEHDFSAKDLLQAQIIASSFGLDLADVLSSPAIMDDIITSGGFEKYLSDLDLLDVLFGKFKEGPIGKLVETMGIQGNLEAIETLFDPEILEWMKNPTSPIPPQAWLDFVSEYDPQLISLVGEQGLLPSKVTYKNDGSWNGYWNLRLKATERLAELFNLSQTTYSAEAMNDSNYESSLWKVTDNNTGETFGYFKTMGLDEDTNTLLNHFAVKLDLTY
ncbi:MAG: hypothetical protein HYU97_03515 [Deltaproteobacteria bacterium]|nr:hypothetical protein [Deltaproteobacteria bacterium]